MTQPSSGNRTTPTTREHADAAQVLSSVADVPVIPATHVLRDYALLADGHRGVLVGPQGDCAWLCFPGWSDAAVFGSLVGSGGHYLIQPRGRWVWGGYYEDGTLIWNSRWVTESGIFESREALCYPASHDRAVLLRRVRALDTDGELLVALDPRADYGRRSVGSWKLRTDCWESRDSDMSIRWWGAADAVSRAIDHHRRLELQLELKAGEYHDFIVEFTATKDEEAVKEYVQPDPDACWRMTRRASPRRYLSAKTSLRAKTFVGHTPFFEG